jgi:glycosyltransferase involved in cell wall biosynthesis
MILKDVLIFSEFDSSGGTREFLKQLILINNKLNINSHVVSEKIDNDMVDFFNKEKVNFSIIKKRNSIFYKPYFSIIYELLHQFKFIKKVKHDLVISSVGTPGINFFHFFTRSKYLYILHSVPNKNGIKSILHYLIPFYFQGNGKYFFVVSNFLKNELALLWNIKLLNIKVIYNSYRFEKDHVKENKSNKITLLTIGHLTKYKNPNSWLDIAIYFCQKYDFVKFIWVGDGKLIESLINRIPKNFNIKFLGKNTNVNKFYDECDIYLNFSEMESLGMGVVDAISYGIPCVVRNVGGLCEIIDHEYNGFTFTNQDEAKFYIDKLINNSQLRKEMGAYSINNKKKIFSPERQLADIKILYQNLMNNRKITS